MGDPPFRAEVIGSLLRPRILKDTATAIANGKAAAADYQAVLEREIGRVVARQEELGLRSPPTASSAALLGSASSSKASTAFA